MDELFFECNSAFEGAMQNINLCLESAIFTYTDELLTNHYVTEAVKESLWDKLKQFFTKIILSLKDFGKELQIRIDYVIKEKQIRRKLDEMYKELKKNESNAKRVEMVDYWTINKLFNNYYKELSSYAKKFSKVKYTKTWQIEDDLAAFDSLMDMCNAQLDDVYNKKIKVPVKKALNFVENEIRGKSEVMQSINDSLATFREIQQTAENLKTKMNILGADVIPKHVGFIQRMVNAISGFIRKWVTRITMNVVFVFAV